MKHRSIAAGLVAGAVALLSAPAAQAETADLGLPGGSLTRGPGKLISVFPKCVVIGDDHGGAPRSEALTSVEFAGTNEYTGYAFWDATVKNVKPGAYLVTVDCRGKKMSGTLHVPGKVTEIKKPQVAVKPKGAPESGGGGTA
ncbi:hypothetical protein SAMN05421504_102595 [Amycolatopsis xylanica]|uniref:Uncharacterized protein n=1 Tax=Amycolatopsis xylanica TaxID=589385 RepID=A0A1H2ZML0_9PSEU|nr:hypothetical protein [Amycolatopsis xylanica]SDX18762.1 hypothetical protein SAMN05421504_102595 [Amycolatopsis xylanica]